jgi:hypothetical protein
MSPHTEDEKKEEHRPIRPCRRKWLHQCPYLKSCQISKTGPNDQGWTRSGFFILRSRSRSLKKKFSRSDYRSNLRPKLRSNPDHRSDQK